MSKTKQLKLELVAAKETIAGQIEVIEANSKTITSLENKAHNSYLEVFSLKREVIKKDGAINYLKSKLVESKRGF